MTDASAAFEPFPSRRRLLKASVVVGAGLAIQGVGELLRANPEMPANLDKLAAVIKDVRERLHRKVSTCIERKQLGRADGFVYAIDIAQLLIHLAQAGDTDGYLALTAYAQANLIHDSRDDPYCKGFVSWRTRAGEKPDASGTTEALRMARGLWLGAKTFNRPADADLALTLLDGYSRHAGTDQGVWIIRNYFNFSTRCFANNSFLVDYDPDFIRIVAVERKDAVLGQLADNCYGVVKRAVAPCDLLYDIIQPEVSTLYPELNVTAFSPNDVIQFANCCTTAITTARGLPAVSRKVLAFSLNRLHDLQTYYLGRTGEPFGDKPATVREYTLLILLAKALSADQAAATVAERCLNDWTWCADHAESMTLYMAGEILLATHALMG